MFRGNLLFLSLDLLLAQRILRDTASQRSLFYGKVVRRFVAGRAQVQRAHNIAMQIGVRKRGHFSFTRGALFGQVTQDTGQFLQCVVGGLMLFLGVGQDAVGFVDHRLHIFAVLLAGLLQLPLLRLRGFIVSGASAFR